MSALNFRDCDYSLGLQTEKGTQNQKNLSRTNYVRETWKAFRSSGSNDCI